MVAPCSVAADALHWVVILTVTCIPTCTQRASLAEAERKNLDDIRQAEKAYERELNRLEQMLTTPQVPLPPPSNQRDGCLGTSSIFSIKHSRPSR